MPHYRLAAFDMDGTLLNTDKEIPASAMEACRRAWKAGKILALDTGRAVSELSLYPFSEMGIRYGSCACGTVIYDFEARRVLATRTIPRELIPVLVDASRKEDLMMQVMVDGIGYVEAADVDRMEHFRMGVYQPLYKETSSFAEDIRAFALANADRINKINMYHSSPKSRARTLERLSGLPLDFTFAETTSLETTPQGVSKGTGLADLCEVLGVPIAEAIGVGDAFNDVPMLKMAGLGAAMGNSNEEALRAADVVVKDNDHDGIAEVIDKYLLG
jgi:Cof subfamily protein (haloacid dehalogenase superfamily)